MRPTDGPLPLVIRRAATLVPTLWKNGRGTTCEIGIFPDGASLNDFVWRASMAEISIDGPFSHFPGVDRTLVLLGGAGMELDLQSRQDSEVHHALREPFSTVDFSGEAPMKATLLDGPTHDFNLMVRRDVAAGEVSAWRGPGVFPLPDDLVLLFVVRGVAALTGADPSAPVPIALDPCDSVKLSGAVKPGLAIELPANGVVLAVRVHFHENTAVEAN